MPRHVDDGPLLLGVADRHIRTVGLLHLFLSRFGVDRPVASVDAGIQHVRIMHSTRVCHRTGTAVPGTADTSPDKHPCNRSGTGVMRYRT